jgi:surface antigen
LPVSIGHRSSPGREAIRNLAATGRKLLLAAVAALSLIVTVAVPAVAADDYPAAYRTGSVAIDASGFYTRQCVSFVAWRLGQGGLPMRGASLTGPNGQTRYFGNGANWDSAARQVGFTVDGTPTVGSVAQWHGSEDGAFRTGHVAYVAATYPDGRVLVEEYNWSAPLRYGQRVVRAPRFIHFTAAARPAPPGPPPAPPPAPAPTPPPPPQPPALAWYHTTAALNARAGPGTGYGVARVIPSGVPIGIACQTRSGSLINGSGIWDRLADGTYVTDYYTTTPAFNNFSPGISRC